MIFKSALVDQMILLKGNLDNGSVEMEIQLQQLTGNLLHILGNTICCKSFGDRQF